jgi:hypothetical protein
MRCSARPPAPDRFHQADVLIDSAVGAFDLHRPQKHAVSLSKHCKYADDESFTQQYPPAAMKPASASHHSTTLPPGLRRQGGRPRHDRRRWTCAHAGWRGAAVDGGAARPGGEPAPRSRSAPSRMIGRFGREGRTRGSSRRSHIDGTMICFDVCVRPSASIPSSWPRPRSSRPARAGR